MRISDWSSDVCSSDLGAMVPDCTRNVVGDTGRCLMPLRHFSDAWVSQRANESPAGGGSHDPDQATARTDPRRPRDHTRGDLGGAAMGGCKPRLPASAWTPLVRSVRRATLTAMLDFTLVILLRLLRTNLLLRAKI